MDLVLSCTDIKGSWVLFWIETKCNLSVLVTSLPRNPNLAEQDMDKMATHSLVTVFNGFVFNIINIPLMAASVCFHH